MSHLPLSPQVLSLSCLLSLSLAAPMAESESQFLAGLPFGGPPVPAPTCVTETDVLVTQVCTPAATEVCERQVVDTEEIEYEKICQDVVDVLCDAPSPAAPVSPYARYGKREADSQVFAPAHAVARTITARVTHACREIVTEHCVDSPRVVGVPVEVEHCHTVTKVACEPVETPLPRTVCTPVETTHVEHANYGFPYGYRK